MMRPAGLAPLAAALLALPPVHFVAAQELRTVTTSKQYRGQDTLRADIDFAAGKLKIRAGDPAWLYRMELSYDPERFAPLSRLDSAGRTLQLGVKSSGESGITVSAKDDQPQDGTIELNPATAISLDVTLGAAEADLDLGGLKISSAVIQTGASQTTLRFSSPNRIACERLEISVGAAEFSALQLGNASCRTVKLDGGVGGVLVDLTGAWKNDANLTLSVALGQITLRLPREVGIELTLDRFLSNFSPDGFVRDGRVYRSSNFATATRKLTLALTSTMGGVTVEWK
jgi:hypothetical protein